MKNLTPFALILILTGCSGPAEPSKEDILAEFMKDFNEFYETYARADIGFIDYYADDVITMDTRGEIITGNEMYREAWTKNFKNYEINLLEYTEPGIVYSKNQIVTYNDYDELFISKETGDTIRVKGTWIGVWQKNDENWEVKMNTFHLKE